MAEIEKSKKIETLDALTAISPLDGRYREKVEALAPYSSEMALIKTRIGIEAKYLIALSDVAIARPLSALERETLKKIGPNLTLEQAQRVKEIENTTKHDVKAMERAFREFVSATSLENITEMIHFGLTSEDVNNLSYRLMLKGATNEVCIPAMDKVVDKLAQMAKEYRDVPMLARTHGQPAVPTTIGKEIANMAVRLNRGVREIEDVELTGKLNGASGNFNALRFAAPHIDWVKFSNNFVKSLGFNPNLITTQINPYDDMIKMFQAVQRVNNIILNIDQDMWRYISDDWFVQSVKKGEIGSSVMPQKVNPINFENSEGNVQISNSLLEGFARKLSVSRLQRDLSDSTTVRNVGVALGYGLLGYLNTLEGLARISPNLQLIEAKLNENWTVLTEGVQTLLRKDGVADPYSIVATISKGKKIGKDDWNAWVDNLEVSLITKTKLLELSPQTYIGYAARLTDIALEEINALRRK